MVKETGKYEYLQIRYTGDCEELSGNMSLVKGVYSQVEEPGNVIAIIFNHEMFDVDMIIDLITNLSDNPTEFLYELEVHDMLKQFDEDGYDEEGYGYGVMFEVFFN